MEQNLSIQFTHSPKEAFDQILTQLNPDQLAILVDENTSRHCLPHFNLDAHPNTIEIKSGEINKNIQSCTAIWESLTNWGFSRKSLLINLGGGVIGDMGGFAASTYKRGIRFVNFPTTLLAMVDANIGGKLGIDFMGFKNHIGLFNDPEQIIIYEGFLKTLPERELRSGYAEVIKHGLIYDEGYWKKITGRKFPHPQWRDIIQKSVEIKSTVVEIDPKEQGLRKILNFGHTLGHAIETWYLNHQKSLLHGEAIAVGMILEADLSAQLQLISKDELMAIRDYLIPVYGKVDIPPLSDLTKLMNQDKKNQGKGISFSLLEGIGNCAYDKKVDDEMIANAIKNYAALK